MKTRHYLILLLTLSIPAISGAIEIQVSELDTDGEGMECLVTKSRDESPSAVAISFSCSGIEFSGLRFSNDRTLVGVKQKDDLLTILIASKDYQQSIGCISGEDGLLARVILDLRSEDWVVGVPHIEAIAAADSDSDFSFQAGEDSPEQEDMNPDGKLTVYPNPGNGHFMISYSGSSSKIWGQIFDVSGARVLSFTERLRGGAEEILFDWDGRNQNGHKLSSGVYFAYIKDDQGLRLAERFVLIK